MTFPPLPYLARPAEEAHLRDFLLRRLEPQQGLPKALLLSGPPGVGKRTLLQHVFQSDPRLGAYRFANAVTREILTNGAGLRANLAVMVDIAAPVLSAFPFAGAPVGVLQAVAKHHLTKEITADTALDPFLEGASNPLLLVVPGFDPEDHEALRELGRWINRSRDRELPRALLILDDSPRLNAPKSVMGATTPPRISHGLARLREYVRDDDWLEVMPLSGFSADQCRDAFVPLGLSTEWAHVLHQLSEGGIPELQALWERLQERSIVVPEAGRWKARQSASASPGWELVQDHVRRLMKARLGNDTIPEARLLNVPEERLRDIHEERLLDALHLAACMGPTFLPQAVAEALLAADPKRDRFDTDAWEDLWYELLEDDDAAHSAIAPRCNSEDGPEILQGDARACFVHAFRDPVHANLLRAAARKMWEDWHAQPLRPNTLLVGAGKALEEWLARTFEETWPQALRFRAALLRIQRRDWEASRLEELDFRIRLEEKLRSQVGQERLRVQQGKEAGNLYAVLLWYAAILEELGQYEEEIVALREATDLADAGRVALSSRDHLQLQSRVGLAWAMYGEYRKAEPLLVDVLRQHISSLGSDHPDTLNFVHNLAWLYFAQGRYVEAEELYLRVLRGCERMLVPQ